MLFNSIVGLGVGVVDAILEADGVLSSVYSLAAILPGLAVFTLRMYDIGKSGWWWLIGLVPVVGGIVLLVFACTDSQPGNNAFGPNPKGC